MIEAFVIAGLASWRLSSLLVNERGPFDLFVALRGAVVRTNNATLIGMFGCVWCMSMYVGLLSTIVVVSGLTIILLPAAISGLAIVMDTIIAHRRREPESARQRPD